VLGLKACATTPGSICSTLTRRGKKATKESREERRGEERRGEERRGEGLGGREKGGSLIGTVVQ
jgi:hypothetical protein